MTDHATADQDTAPAPHAGGPTPPPPDPDTVDTVDSTDVAETVDIAALGSTIWTVGDLRAVWVTEIDGRDGTFTGRWLDPDLPSPRTYDESLVLHLTALPGGYLDIAGVLAHNGRWVPVGSWPAMGPDWPQVVRPTCRMIMHLLTCPQVCDIPPDDHDHTGLAATVRHEPGDGA
jgi:hypothetical protein